MVDYTFSEIIDQTVTFIPGADTINFGSISASDLEFQIVGTLLRIANGNDVVYIDSTNDTIESTTPAVFTPTNAIFSDGSIIAAGDLTSGVTADTLASSIDFTTNATLTGLINENNQIFGLEGADTIDLGGGLGDLKIFGGQDGDSIVAGIGNNTIYGGDGFADSTDGADSIVAGQGTSLIYGNAGADQVTFSSTPTFDDEVTFYGGDGADSFTAGASHAKFTIDGGPGADVITLQGLGSFNAMYGGDGADVINLSGGTGDITLFGGTGIVDAEDEGDSVTLGSGNALVYGNAGADAIEVNTALTNTATIYLGSGADSLTSGVAAGSYVIYGNTDSDNIDLTNHTGDSTVFGGNGVADSTDGADSITGSTAGSDTIYGNSGADVITLQTSGINNSLVYAGADNDSITAAPTSTLVTLFLYGNTGVDNFSVNFSAGQPIARIMDYGAFEDEEDILTVTLAGGASASSLQLSFLDGGSLLKRAGDVSPEQIYLEGFTGNFSASNAVFSDSSVLATNYAGTEEASLAGSTSGDYLIAGGFGDTLTAGGGGNDKLIGSGANETFVLTTAEFTSADTIDGNAGRLDTIDLTTAGTAITDASFANVSNIGILSVASGDFSTNGITLGTNATAAGLFAIDMRDATSANVNAEGMSSSQLYLGATGADTFFGSSAADAIDGKEGDDIIFGRRGGDNMIGGEGNDTFAYSEGIVEGFDVIQDFDFGTSASAVDTLRFNASAAGLDLGNNDDTLDGAIIDEVVSAGALGTEVIILQTVGVATADITATLDIINGDVDPTDNSISLFFDTTRGHAVMYMDNNGNTAGGHTILASFTNITSLSDMDNIDFGDFELVV